MANTYLVGCTHSAGDFVKKETGEVIAYDNLALSFITDSDVSGGFRGFEVKVKFDEIQKVCGVDFGKISEMLAVLIKTGKYNLYPCEICYVLDRSGKSKLSKISIGSVQQ